MALGCLCTPEYMPSICLVYGFGWLASLPRSRFEVRCSAFDVRYFPVAVKRLILNPGGNLPPHGQVGQKGFDLPFPIRQVLPAAHVMEINVPLNPINVRALGMDRVMVKPQDIADLNE